MEITYDNFEEHKDYIKDCITLANFVAIDQEFSGLPRIFVSSSSPLTEGFEKYWRAKNDVKRLSVIQFGLTTFQFSVNKWLVHSFLFYLLPSYNQSELTFTINSAKFLATKCFDFNKLFSCGISYLNRTQELEQQQSYFPQTLSTFSQIIIHLLTLKKQIVGHNVFLDLLFLIDKFVDYLPNTLSLFVETLHDLIPHLFDTKVMTTFSHIHFSNSSLETVYVTLKNNHSLPEYCICTTGVLGGVDFESSSMFHNAMYDSFVTGLSYLMLRDHFYLTGMDESSFNHKFNHIVFMASNGVDSMLHLTNTKSFSPSNDKSNVMVVSTLVHYDDHRIIRLFSNYAPITIHWVDDNWLCFVKISGGNVNFKTVVRSLSIDKTVLVIPYYKYRAIWRRKVPYENESTSDFIRRAIREHKDYKDDSSNN